MKESKYAVGYYAGLKLANALLLKMREKEISKSGLAQLTGTGRGTVTRWLNPGRNLTIFTAAFIADALGCELRMDLVEKGAAQPRPNDSEPQCDWGRTIQVVDGGAIDITSVTHPMRSLPMPRVK